MILHKHSVEHPAAKAVRTRRNLIAQTFQEIEKSKYWKSRKKLKILSVACGPSYELKDIIKKANNVISIHY